MLSFCLDWYILYSHVNLRILIKRSLSELRKKRWLSNVQQTRENLPSKHVPVSPLYFSSKRWQFDSCYFSTNWNKPIIKPQLLSRYFQGDSIKQKHVPPYTIQLLKRMCIFVQLRRPIPFDPQTTIFCFFSLFSTTTKKKESQLSKSCSDLTSLAIKCIDTQHTPKTVRFVQFCVLYFVSEEWDKTLLVS